MRLFTLGLAFASAVFAQPITIAAGTVLQPIDGFGASTAFVSSNLTSDQANWLWTTNMTTCCGRGIGLSINRVQIVPDLADCTATYGSCVTVSSGATMTTADLYNAKLAVARGAKIVGSMWSPPGSMKSNGSFGSGGNMLAGTSNANYPTLAAIDVSWVAFMIAQGVPISSVLSISIQNEPDESESYPSCVWTAQQLHDYTPYLSTGLSLAGYSSVLIALGESSSWETTYAATAMNDATVAADVGLVIAHAYSGSASGLTLAALSNVTTQHLWETEVSSFESFNGDMANALTWATEMYQWLTTASVNAWFYWLGPGTARFDGGNDNEGLTDINFVPASRGYVMGNFANFVGPGCHEIGVTNPTGLYVTAFTCPNGSLTIVAENVSGGDATNQQFSITGYSATQLVPWLTSATYNLQQFPSVPVSGGSFTQTVCNNCVLTLTTLNSASTSIMP